LWRRKRMKRMKRLKRRKRICGEGRER
jgi:hypothetical protein